MSGWSVHMEPSIGLLATVVAALLFAVALWREDRPLRPFRAAVIALAVLSLLLLFLRPSRLVETVTSSATLLTPGAPAESLDRATDGEERFTLGISAEEARRAEHLPDLAWLGRHRPEIHRLHIAGHGPEPWEWESFGGAVELRASAPPAPGVEDVIWPRIVRLGEDLVVAGRLAGLGGSASRLRLEGPGGVAADLDLDGTTTAFTLRTRPRDAGRFLYRLILDIGGETVAAETVPIVVESARPPTVLWLEDAPGFETRHVKSWLAEIGGSVAVRSRLSRERFREEFYGFPDAPQKHPPKRLAPLRRELLARFDLVVVDGETLAALTAAELDALRTAIGDGLGLLLRGGEPDEAELPTWLAWPKRTIGELDEMLAVAVWPGAPEISALAVSAREIVPSADVVPLISDPSGRILAASRRVGAGHIGLTLLAGTYRFVQAGQGESHRQVWSRLAGRLARPEVGPRWRLPAGPAFVDRPVEIVVETKLPARALTAAAEGADPVVLELRPDASETTVYRATFWPRSVGWHRLELADGTGEEDAWLYVEPAGTWPTWRAARRLEAARERAIFAPMESAGEERTKRPREVSRGWFFGLFLLAVGILWGEERWRR